MHRIDTSGATADNEFQDGNPAIGQLGTEVDADFMNDLTENICKVIEAADIALAKGDFTQLHAAIVAIATGAAGTGGGSVPTSREIESGGLVQGGGALTGNLTLTVPAASGAEVLAGTVATKAVTPAALAGAFSFTKAVPGRINLFGFRIMWGIATANANGFTNVPLPFGGFAGACVWGDFMGGSADTDAHDNDPFVASVTTTTLSIFNARDGAVAGKWFAFGW